MTAIRDVAEIRPPRLGRVKEGVRHEWADDSPDVETVHDLDLATLWEISQRVTARSWAGKPYCPDMLNLASETFVHGVNNFDGWCLDKGLKPNRVLFASYMNRSIHFATLKYWRKVIKPELDDVHIDEYSVDGGSAESVFTELRTRSDDRSLLRSIVPQARALFSRRERFILALLVWEELPLTRAAKLMEMNRGTFDSVAKTASVKLLQIAHNELSDEFTQVLATRKWKTPLPISFIEHVVDRYGMPPDAWLDHVEIDYTLDPSYIAEIFDRAHGKAPRRGNLGTWKPSIDEEQHNEIIERRAAGETQKGIAEAMGLTRKIVENAEAREHKKRQQG